MAIQSEAYRTDRIKRLLNNVTGIERATFLNAELVNVKTSTWKFSANFPAQKENLKTSIHIVERIPSEGQGKPAQFIPIRFIFANKISKDDKLLLAYDAFVLSEMLRSNVSNGKIIHGDNYLTVKVRTLSLVGTIRKLISNIAILIESSSPPDLILKRHCIECEYQTQCRQKAIEKDDLSLIAGGTINIFKKYSAKLYETTYNMIISKLCLGSLIHADETKISVGGNDCYVWVFTSMEEVVYFCTETREGDFVRSLLKAYWFQIFILYMTESIARSRNA